MSTHTPGPHFFVGGSIDGQPEYCDKCGELYSNRIHSGPGPTPGPWTCEVSEESPNGLIVGRAGEDVVAEMQSNGQTATQVIANARLIAAAPELLEALKECVIALDVYDRAPHESYVNKKLARERAESAIGKAKGE
jgi:hypothetical protein